jgi:hypothetical protein
MRDFLKRAMKLGINVEGMDSQAAIYDLLRDVCDDRECFESAFLPTALHDDLIAAIRERIETGAGATGRRGSLIEIAAV